MLIALIMIFATAYSEHTHSEHTHSEHNWVFDTRTDDIQFCLVNSSSSSVSLFYDLPLDEKSQKLIHELIKTIAEKNIWGLLFKKKELEKIGKKIDDRVHPMRFMGHILGDPKLRKWLKEIKNSSFKWDHFIDGFANRMKEEAARNNLLPYVAGMAHHLHVDQARILSYIHSKDYEGLVKALM